MVGGDPADQDADGQSAQGGCTGGGGSDEM